MTFKLSSISKIFFTYICPRFYGGAPSTPANTTSTTTVNQSPWQNPVYQALMLGTATNPGPITSMLNNNEALMAQYNAINTNGLPAAQQASLGSWNPAGSPTAAYVNQLNPETGRYIPTANPALATPAPAPAPAPAPVQQAAQGGIMGLKGYAAGSTATTDTSDPATSNAPYTLTDALGKTAYFDPTTGETTNPGLLQLQQEAAGLTNPAVMNTGVTGLTQAYNKTQALANYAPTNVTANKADVANANAAQMQGAANISADKLQQYQMQGPQAITAPTATAGQMVGPQSWLAAGTAQAYMNPYEQQVLNQQIAQSNRDYQQQLNGLNAQAVGANAYGGSRQAIQQAEAARNQMTNLANIEAQGLSNAYTQGTQQFNTAQGQQLQAGQANLGAYQQTSLANQAAAIQAMMANQGMDFNTALQNLQANLGVQNTQSAQDLQASMQNQTATNATAQYNASNQQAVNLANQQAANVANNAYAQNALSASQANQAAGLSANSQNLGAQSQAGSIANMGVNAGSAQNAATLANMQGQGAVAQATQNLAQSYLDQQSTNAQNWLNAPNAINSAAVNAINSQPTAGGTTASKNTSTPASWARGGLIKNGKVSKRGTA